MNTLECVARTLARLIHTVGHIADALVNHADRIRALEEQVAVLQERLLDQEEANT